MSAKKAAKKAAPESPGAPAAKKAAKKATSAKKAAKSKSTTAASAPPVDLEVSAYLNYRSRVENGLPGDDLGDWLAAEQSSGS